MTRVLRKRPITGRIELTPRDQTLIWAVHRFRFITTDQAQAMTKTPGRSAINTRLAELYDHDYLDRPAIQKEIYAYRDKRPTIHALGQRGAAWLADTQGVEFPKGKGWKTANQLKSGERLEHRLGVTDCGLIFQAAIDALADVRLIHAEELWSTVPPKLATGRPYRLPTKIKKADGSLAKRATDPDWTFGFGRQSADGEQRALLFLEYDNNSESFGKTNRMDSAILQKLLCYSDARRRKLHTSLYGLTNFRVLFVVNAGPERVKSMLHLFERHQRDLVHPGHFLFTTFDAFQSRGPCAGIWVNGAGDPVGLL